MKNLLHLLLKIFNKKIFNLNTDLFELRKLISELRPIKTEYELIRIGNSEDGGYLLPDDLKDIEAIFSPGVSDIYSFELEMLEKYRVKSYMCDFTVDKIKPNNNELIFEKKHLGVNNNFKYQRLEDWVRINSKTNNLILQMDIEGSEYPVILDTPINILKKFRIMIIEFHNMDLLFNAQFFEVFKSVINKILTHFSVVHIHPNNCCGSYTYKDIEIPRLMEITFINNKRLSKKKYPNVRSKRHKLDIDNTKMQKLDLPKIWYSN